MHESDDPCLNRSRFPATTMSGADPQRQAEWDAFLYEQIKAVRATGRLSGLEQQQLEELEAKREIRRKRDVARTEQIARHAQARGAHGADSASRAR